MSNAYTDAVLEALKRTNDLSLESDKALLALINALMDKVLEMDKQLKALIALQQSSKVQ